MNDIKLSPSMSGCIREREKITWEVCRVHNCPICHRSHDFQIKVVRLPIKGVKMDPDIRRLRKRRRLIRGFFCSEEDKQFKGIITLFHSTSEVIKDITIHSEELDPIQLRESEKV